MAPGAATQDRLGKGSEDGYAPEWKGNAAVAWTGRVVTASLSGHYIGSYEDYGATTRRIGNFWTFDVNARYDLREAFASSFTRSLGLYANVGVRNLTDKLGEYSNFGAVPWGYDPSQADMFGRYVYVQLGGRL